MGSILNKKLTGQFDKVAISLYLGLGILATSGVEMAIVLGKGGWEDNVDKIGKPLYSEDPQLWARVIAIAVMGTAQQYFLICKLK